MKKETVDAVRGLDLRVARGEMVALLGPNGAGKSTTLRMLTTLLPPTSGSAAVAGFDVVTHQSEVRARIGYIGQGNGAGHSQRGRDELISQGRAYGMSTSHAHARAAELVESLDLGAVADRVVSSLSGGQRRRLDIAMGLIHAPELLFLDEPSTGLDPQNRANLQEHVHLRQRRRRPPHGSAHPRCRGRPHRHDRDAARRWRPPPRAGAVARPRRGPVSPCPPSRSPGRRSTTSSSP